MARSTTPNLLAGVLAAALALSGCWDRTGAPTGPEVAGTPRLSLLALGDAGNYREREWLPDISGRVGLAMEAADRQRPVDALVFLGDNFYPAGLRELELTSRIAMNVVRPYCRFVDLAGPRSSEVARACALPAGERHPVPILAVVGNHDGSKESISLQTEALPRFVTNWEMPRRAITVRELGQGVSLILLQSYELVRKPERIGALSEAIRSARGPWRILVAHHPFTEPSGPFETRYRDGARQAIDEAGLPVQLALGGHHHLLQILAPSPPLPLQVVSGAGGRAADPPSGQPAELWGKKQNGFARVDLVEREGEERLVVSMYTTHPLWRPAGRPELGARWSVGLDGTPREESIR
jgi:hypothetical protein